MTASFLFLVGTGRCGSTLVHEVLARHARVGFVANVQDRWPVTTAVERWNAPLYRMLPEGMTRKGRLRFAPSEAYHILDEMVSPCLSRSVRDLRAEDATPWLVGQVREFFSTRAARQSCEVFLHKFTGWPRAGLLEQALPGARFVHVVRDGRAVANSWLQMPWWLGYQGPTRWRWGPLSPEHEEEWRASGRSFVVLAGIAWKLLMDAHAEAQRELPSSSWLTVRYEDVLSDPRREFERLLAFAGLDWDEGFDRGFRRHQFRHSRHDAFRSELGPEQLAVLEASLGRHLAASGYLLEHATDGRRAGDADRNRLGAR